MTYIFQWHTRNFLAKVWAGSRWAQMCSFSRRQCLFRQLNFYLEPRKMLSPCVFGYVVLLRGVVKRSRKRGVVNQTCHVLTPGRGFRQLLSGFFSHVLTSVVVEAEASRPSHVLTATARSRKFASTLLLYYLSRIGSQTSCQFCSSQRQFCLWYQMSKMVADSFLTD